MAAEISVRKALAAAVRRSGLFLCGMTLAAAAAANPGSPAQSVNAALTSPQAAPAKAALLQPVTPDKTPQGIAPEAWSRMMAEVQARTYAPRSGPGGSLLAANPAQHLDARFTPRGVVITPRQSVASAMHARATAAPGAPFQLRTRSIDGKPAPTITPVAAANRVEYRGSGYTEWYVNDAGGMEQGWTLAAPAAGGRAPLIRVGVSGARTVAEDAGTIRIEDHQGKLRYRYAGLKVTDAGQRVLPAQLRLVRPGLIEIAVDDRGAQYPLTVDPSITVTQAVTLSDPAATSNDLFGNAVAVNGDTVVVGAYANKGGLYQGAAYIYSRNQGGAGAWGLAASLSDPAASNGDNFGTSVAVDGDTVVVGAQGSSGAQGKAYIYSRNQGGAGVWGLAASLSDPPASSGAQFGSAVAVNGDTVVVGAYTAGTGGAAYVYSRGPSGAGSGSGVWSLAASLADPAAASGDEFGSAVAVYGDTAVVGAYGSGGSKGAAYIYSRNQGGAGSWGLADSLSDPAAAANDFYGYAVSVNGDTVVVGAYGTSGSKGAAYVYSRTPTSGSGDGSGVWALAASLSDPLATAGDFFGRALAVYGDLVLAGAPDSSSNQGATYLFGRNQGGASLWGLAASLSLPTGAGSFGYAVALDGGTVVAGAYSSAGDQGRAYLFDIGAAAFAEAAGLSLSTQGDNFGSTVAVDGDTVVVGVDGSGLGPGKVYIYNRNQGGAGHWGLATSLSDPAGSTSDNFARAVDVNGDTLVVGSPGGSADPSKAYVYSRNQGGADQWGLAVSLDDPGSASLDDFGNSVAVDGDTVVVGAYATSSNQGKAYIYSRNEGGTGQWGLLVSLSDPGAANEDVFGSSVAVEGDTAIIGASGAEKAYIYSRNQGGAGTWGLAATLSDPSEAYADQFGLSVAVSGDTATASAVSGAYIYGRNQGGAGHWGSTTTLSNPGTSNNQFGVALALDGDTLAVTAPSFNSHPGLVYVYNRNQGGVGAWGLFDTLGDPTGKVTETFGYSVAVGGDTMVVGAQGVNTPGAAYVFSPSQAYLSVSPTSLVFGSQGLNTGPSAPLPLTVSNSGSTNLVVSSMNFSGTNASDFSVSDNGCVSTLTPGGNCTIQIEFAPTGTATGNRSASLNIVSNASSSSTAVPLSGTAAAGQPPAGPTGLAITSTGVGQVSLNWNAVNGASDYYVFYGTSSGDETVKSAAIEGTNGVISGLNNGTTYYFVVKAYFNSAGVTSDASNEVSTTTPLPAPTNLQATVVGSGQVALTWTGVSGASDYYVFYGTSPGAETTKSAAVTGTSTTISGLGGAPTYYFVVKAYRHASGITSAASNQVSVPLQLAAPTGLTVSGTGSGQVSLTWTGSSGASDYYVFYGTTPGDETTKSAAIVGTSTTITGLVNGTPYYFVVKAYNHTYATTSPASNEVSATPN